MTRAAWPSTAQSALGSRIRAAWRAPALHRAREACAERLIESFNGKFRDEGLNEHWFMTLQEAQLVIEAWRREYNEERTHSSIRDVTPQEFITNHQNGSHLTQEFTSSALV